MVQGDQDVNQSAKAGAQNLQDLSAQERAVLEMIVANPFVGQQQIADALKLARSTVAAHIVQLTQKGFVLGRGYYLPENKRIVCIGGAVFDRKYHAHAPLISETSNPVSGYRSHGGVARNVTENLARLGVNIGFVSILGDDETGRAILDHLRLLGVDVSRAIVTNEAPTAEYAAILGPDNELALGIADMGIFDLFKPETLETVWPHLASADWVFADCNLPQATLETLLAKKTGSRFRLAVDTVSAPKALRLPQDLSGVDLLFLNLDEAHSLLRHPAGTPRLTAEQAINALHARGVAKIVMTMGAGGVHIGDESGIRHIASVPAQPVDITGAGDALISGTLYCLLDRKELPDAVRTGTLLATLTTESDASVHPDLSAHFLEANLHRIRD
ncbi:MULTISPECIES: PfkB family carbohydrate kinase [Pseudochrobactrum]|uniref:Pseudouridine kinase n=2 Tax=Pseudochrobactrum TaxID=354349 RepID=A0A7W8AHT8_9HYPH|nr:MULTISPECIES: PfkB family carbohydrate kinase [Pseudochrobactrum]MBB5090129.1 pseudouridine kinase [Pseudochrobactrum saccharolyticum]UCA45876.1 PfkB family carbohydrate kinase [Pseudochrobactrum sp. XF203]